MLFNQYMIMIILIIIITLIIITIMIFDQIFSIFDLGLPIF